MTASHSHGDPTDPGFRTPRRLGAIIAWALAPFLVLIAIGAVRYWPDGSPAQPLEVPDLVRGTVVALSACEEPADPTADPDQPDLSGQACAIATLREDEGPDTGDEVEASVTLGPNTPDLAAGTSVLLAPLDDPEQAYALADVDRTAPLLGLSALFATAVVLLARWKGVLALVGLAASILILAVFVLPSLLAGNPPVAVAAVGAGAIAVVSTGLAHGFSARTGVALIGTLVALVITTLLGDLATRALNFTGVASEDAAYLSGVSGGTLDLRGLLLAGLVIGALGVLDDVTVTQSATVWEVFGAHRAISLRALWRSGMRVGKDHVAAVVNTLVLAYVGAALPLFLLITMSTAPAVQSLSNEVIAAEVVRSMVGGLGIVASVPITTGLAAMLLVSSRERAGSGPQSTDPGHSPA